LRAIAFAIICAAYLLIPKHELDLVSPNIVAINAITFLISIMGFWICIIIGK
jgi:hypothetical protein